MQTYWLDAPIIYIISHAGYAIAITPYWGVAPLRGLLRQRFISATLRLARHYAIFADVITRYATADLHITMSYFDTCRHFFQHMALRFRAIITLYGHWHFYNMELPWPGHYLRHAIILTILSPPLFALLLARIEGLMPAPLIFAGDCYDAASFQRCRYHILLRVTGYEPQKHCRYTNSCCLRYAITPIWRCQALLLVAMRCWYYYIDVITPPAR